MKKVKKDNHTQNVMSWCAGILIGAATMWSVQYIMPKTALKQTVAEVQLARYKNAEKTCGPDNVKEERDIKKGDNDYSEKDDFILPTGHFLCDDLEFAAMDEASQSAITEGRLNSTVNSYCDYKAQSVSDGYKVIPFSQRK